MAKVTQEVLNELKQTMDVISKASTFIAEVEVKKAAAVVDINRASARQAEIIGEIEEKYGKESVLDLD